MVETKRVKGAGPRRRSRAYARAVLLFIVGGFMIALLGPLYAYLATNFSGRLELRQQISAADLQRGFQFGPVYMDAGRAGRYFISAQLPETPEGVWRTSFEVLDAQERPVFKQDELRFTGEYQFQPGQRDTYNKVFRLNEGPGYYYFRYTALNGSFDANPKAPPVVEFSVRQGVIDGMALWLPAFGMVALGLLMALLGITLVYRAGTARAAGAAPSDLAPGPVERPAGGRGLLPSR